MSRRFSLQEVRVFVGEESQGTYATLCNAGAWIADSDDTLPADLSPCNSVGCVCVWEGEERLRPATTEEARNWFDAMRQLAAQATIERDRDL
jgi:hypothetical protein